MGSLPAALGYSFCAQLKQNIKWVGGEEKVVLMEGSIDRYK